ncbi:hypothetical protein VCSRO75_3558 [Vibrio cholerae]|nr:hypothetical protein VCSRO75_3558 [Vibrio cholerae]
MKDKEFVLERFHFQTENGLVPAELQTEDGTKPFYVNIELTDAIRAAHELTRCLNWANKLLKRDSQRVVFLQCIGFSD